MREWAALALPGPCGAYDTKGWRKEGRGYRVEGPKQPG